MVEMQHLPLLKGFRDGPRISHFELRFSRFEFKLICFLFDGSQSLGLANFSLLLDHALLVFATDLLYHDFFMTTLYAVALTRAPKTQERAARARARAPTRAPSRAAALARAGAPARSRAPARERAQARERAPA